MSLINALNIMKVQDREQDLITFRTSRAERVLGVIFILAGMGICCFMLLSKFFEAMRNFCFFSLGVSVIFVLIGFVLSTNKKCVIIDKVLKKIELEESCQLCYRVATIHFDEILKFELTRSSERLCSSTMGVWVIKAYIKRSGATSFAVENVFYAVSLQEAKDVAKLLSISCRKEVLDNTGLGSGNRVALRVA